jgi:hypothetical protein
LTRLEEQAEQSALSDNVAKRAKGKEWNQYQQNDNASGNQLVNRATADCGYRIHDPAMMKVSDDHFLQYIQNQEQRQESERPPERGPNESFLLTPFTEVNCVPDAHELGADQSLDSSDTEWREGYPVRLEDCGLEICEGGKADIEIGGNNQKFPQLIGCPSCGVKLSPRRQCSCASPKPSLRGVSESLVSRGNTT